MKKITLALLGVTFLFVFVSCGSKPTNEEAPKPKPPVTEEPVVDEPIAEEPKVEEPEPVVEDKGPTAEELADEEARKNAQELYNQVLSAKQKIDDENLASYDQKNYDAGKVLLVALDALMADDASKGKDREVAAKETLKKFNAVINTAYKKLAKDARDEAYQAKKNADFVKAGVAEKEKYQSAAKDFQDGDSLFSMQSPEKAYNKYISARDVFLAIYESVSEKRAAAAAAIEAAKAKVAETASLASKADNTAPITDENADGIEDEDEQLLEDDNFDDPANAEVDLPEDINDDGNPVVIENELDKVTTDFLSTVGNTLDDVDREIESSITDDAK